MISHTVTRKQLYPRQKAERDRCAEANIRTRKILRHGERNRRILIEFRRGGFEYRYHVTKGWRVGRAFA